MRLLNMLKSKIHRATVTEADLDYIGSISIDLDLLERVDLLPGELVHVWNVANGNRFETYALAAERGSGTIQINGAAAHLATRGDIVIIAAFCMTDEPIVPRQIVVDDANRFVRDLPPFSTSGG